MKIQNKLVNWITLLFTVVFIIIGTLFLITYTHYAKFSIRQHLKSSANICAIFHMEEDELSPSDFKQVRDEYKESVSNIYYQVYGENDELRFGLNLDAVSKTTLDLIREKRSYYFSDENYYAYGLFYQDNEGDFVVITKEKKDILFSQQKMLFVLLLLGLVLSIVMVYVLSKFIAYQAFSPFRDINRAATKLLDDKKNSLQLLVPKTKDELYELITILNKLLKQLEENSLIQKNFVRYVTHEFKTPIATIKGNLEVFLLKDRTPKEYQRLSDKLLREVDGLTQIINTLLAISDIETMQNNRIAQTNYSTDVLIKDIIERVRFNYPSCVINFSSQEENVGYEVRGNRTQMKMALTNLIENAVKYSNGHPVDVLLAFSENCKEIIIKDSGIGIPEEQLSLISKPFYRADNASLKSGSGIGLSIALRILEKNHINYQIESVLNQGTTVTIHF